MLRSTAVVLTRLITGANAVWVDCEPRPDRLRLYFANHGSHLDFATLERRLKDSFHFYAELAHGGALERE